jgi:tetratricopeptide (TPR) repeat protein
VGVGLAILGATFRLYGLYEPSFSRDTYPTISRGEADRRIESTKTYLAAHPEDLEAWVSLATAYYQRGPASYVNAMNALDKARALGATEEQLFYYAGVMYDALGLPEYAINELSKYLRHHPDDYETQVRLGNLHFRLKQFDQAEEFYQQATKKWPKDPTILFNEAIVNKELERYPEALSELNRVRKIAGRLPEGGLFQEGEIYRLQGNLEAAMRDYHQELAAHPDSLPVLQAIEQIVRGKGDFKRARRLRQRIAALKKNMAPPVAVAPKADP